MNKNSLKENPGELVTIYKMAFIYNAIINGWSVKYLDNNKFEFINKDEEIKKEFFLENFLDKFIDSNLNIETILQNMQKSS
tara:strand:- start:65 stop:307 length:243 start_codon:yes stop_codon:yes gene_type:complete